jgi:hypothetical protein
MKAHVLWARDVALAHLPLIEDGSGAEGAATPPAPEPA